MKKIAVLLLIAILTSVVFSDGSIPVDLGQRIDIPFQHGDSLDIEPVVPDSVPRYFLFYQDNADTIRTSTLSLFNSITGLYLGNFTLPATNDSTGNYWLLLKIHQQGKIIQFRYRDYHMLDLLDGDDLIDSLNHIIAQNDSTIDSLVSILDTLRNQDDWMSKEATINALNNVSSSEIINSMLSIVAADTITGTYYADQLRRLAYLYDNTSTIVQNAMTAQGYTPARAGYMDNLLYLDQAVTVARDAIMAVLRDSTEIAIDNKINDLAEATAGSVLKDSLSYQGEAGSLTAESIYNYFIDGSNEEPFWADVSGCTGSGSGPLSCSLYVFDASDTSAIQGVSVAVRPLTGGSPYAIVSTNENGLILTSLNAGTYAYLLFRQGKAFNAIDTITISGAQTDTLWGEDITTSSPPANMTKCRFWVTGADADTIQGVELQWQLVDSLGYNLPDSVIVKIDNTVLSKRPKSTVSDSSYFEINFYPNSLMNYTWTRYRMTIIYPDGTVDEVPYIEIPETSVFDPF